MRTFTSFCPHLTNIYNIHNIINIICITSTTNDLIKICESIEKEIDINLRDKF